MGGAYSGLVFLPPTPSYEDTEEPHYSKIHKKIPSFFFDRRSEGAKFTILYSHGNAEDIGQSKYWMEILSEKLNVNLITYDYEGYGRHQGKSSESNCYQNIDDVYQYLIQEKGIRATDIILYGRSLGSGPTVHMAYEIYKRGDTLGGLILQSPIASAVRVVSKYLARLPGVDTFDNQKKVDTIKCDTFIIHGTEDDVVPFWHGQLLAEKFDTKGHLWDFFEVKGGDHNTLELDHEDEILTKLGDYINHMKSKQPDTMEADE